MQDGRFQRLEELFHAALALPATERDAYLDAACEGDAELRREIDTLLRETGEEQGLLDVSVLDRLGVENLEGREAGRWKIGPRVGEGGLGVVYRANGPEEAAIKFLKPGLDAGAFRRRFAKERRILGALDHPHIAKLLDGGVDETGRPYLAMEFVDGRPLDVYVRENRVPRQERLRLLGQVCRAVQYLHAALVAHGDLKPSNILVTAEGRAKLVDFGAARLLNPPDRQTDETTMTRAFLTPHYASPEQKAGEGPSVASDIYSLGVIVGEVLAEADADVEAIREMCCRAEATERYGSALELEQDLTRYGKNEPVRARRQNLRYRTGKFLRRHVVAVMATAALLAAAVTGGIFQWREVQRDRERLAQMRRIVKKVLENAPSQVVNGSDERRVMREMMETAIAELERSGEEGMELELAAAWRRLGAARFEDGNTPGAMEGFKKSYELAEKKWQGNRDQAAFESQAITLPMWAMAMHSRRGESDESVDLALRSEKMHEEYRRMFGRALPAQNPYYRMALVAAPGLLKKGHAGPARRMLTEALAVARRVEAREETARALIELARVAQAEGRAEEGRLHCQEAARISPTSPWLEQVCGEESLTVMKPADQIAALRQQIAAKADELNHDPERFPTLRRAAGMRQRLARLLYDQGRMAEARRELGKAVEILDELLRRDPENEAVQTQARRARRMLEQMAK